MKFLVSALSTFLIVLLVFTSGCTGDILTQAGVGNFGGTPAPAKEAGPGPSGTTDADCMTVCTRYTGQTEEQCTQACCISGCSEDSPGGSEACYNRCMGTTLSASTWSSKTPVPETTPASGTMSGFTCEYDENLLKTSPGFSGWFNTSCYYNDYCGWWESNDLRPPSAFDQNCINCSIDSSAQPTPTYTPCPVRTQKPGEVTTPVITATTAAASSGACGAGLTQCRVFSTDYCVDLMTDVSHCGTCRWSCPLPNAENGCSGGKCYIQSCYTGWADCNGIAEDGCEVDLDSDDNNCGKCGRVCSLPNSHAICAGEDGDGICEVEYCNEGWLNENGLHPDGCEFFQN